MFRHCLAPATCAKRPGLELGGQRARLKETPYQRGPVLRTQPSALRNFSVWGDGGSRHRSRKKDDVKEGRGERGGGETCDHLQRLRRAAAVTGRGRASTVTVALGSVESHLASGQTQSGCPQPGGRCPPDLGWGPGSPLQVHWTPFSMDRGQCPGGSVGPRSPSSPRPSI